MSSLKLQKINTGRWFTVASHVLNKLSSPAFNIIISLLIVRLHSGSLWGEFVYYSLIVNLTLTFMSWGHQEFLIRIFARNTSSVAYHWSQNLTTRTALYFLCVPVLLAIPATLPVRIALIVWVFALFLYRSFDVLILFHKNFIAALILEIAGHLVLIALILFYPIVSIYQLIIFHFIITSFKLAGIGCLYFYKHFFNHLRFNISFPILTESFPFFLPSLIGFVQSRIDMFIIAFLLSKDDLANYQILITLLSFVHQFALLTIAPFTKNIYRLPDTSITKMANRFFGYGTIGSVLAIPVIFIPVTYYYNTKLPWEIYLISLLTLLPLFYYSIKTYQWFKHHGQYKVVIAHSVMAGATLLISLISIPLFGITGGLLANCAGQWIAFLIFYFARIKQPLT